MDEPKTLNHSKWECKYHVVFIPKYRRESLYKELRPKIGAAQLRFDRLPDVRWLSALIASQSECIMLRPSADAPPVFLCVDPVDFRKSINGLSLIVDQSLEQTEAQYNIFRQRVYTSDG